MNWSEAFVVDKHALEQAMIESVTVPCDLKKLNSTINNHDPHIVMCNIWYKLKKFSSASVRKLQMQTLQF